MVVTGVVTENDVEAEVLMTAYLCSYAIDKDKKRPIT